MATTDRKKVVVRHLPPSFSESAFMKEIGPRFAGLFTMVAFFPGKSSFNFSVKRRTYSRAYIDFKNQEDVIEFCEGFNGHLFVTEKGIHYKALVEYAPHQRVPKMWTKKDVQEGSILEDPEYLKFVDMLAKPVEYLPSAEVQLERKEAQKSLNSEVEPIIITPLMEFVRKKRASKYLSQRPAPRKSVQGGGACLSTSSKMILKRNVDKSKSKDSLFIGSKQNGHDNQPVFEVKNKSRSQIDDSRKGSQRYQHALATSNNVPLSTQDPVTRKKSDMKNKQYTNHTPAWTQNGRSSGKGANTGSRKFGNTLYMDSTKPVKRVGGLATPQGGQEKKVWVAKTGPG